MKVPFKNERTGEVKEVKVGWSWTLFFFAGFLGLPLYLRKLNTWGGVFLALWGLNLLIPYLMPPAAQFDGTLLFFEFFMAIVFIALSIWMGIKGNELTAKNYLEIGWSFAEPDSDAVRFAKGKWGLAI